MPTFDNWEDDLEAVAEAVAAKSKDIEVPLKGADESDSSDDEEE